MGVAPSISGGAAHEAALAKVFGYPTTTEAQDSALSPRGYRAMAGIPRLQFAHVDLLVRAFGTLQGLLAASADMKEGLNAFLSKRAPKFEGR